MTERQRKLLRAEADRHRAMADVAAVPAFAAQHREIAEAIEAAVRAEEGETCRK